MSNIIAIEDFLKHKNPRTSEATLKQYRCKLTRWLRWLNGKKPSQEAGQKYLDFLVRGGLGSSTIHTTGDVIKQYLEFCGIEARFMTPRVVTPPPGYVNQEEFNRLLKAVRIPIERVLLLGLLDTGCRISEFINIKNKDINWDEGTINIIRKGTRPGKAIISDPMLKELKAYIRGNYTDIPQEQQARTNHNYFNSLRVHLEAAQGNPKFKEGTPLPGDTYNNRVFMSLDYYTAWLMLKNLGMKAGVPLHPHMLRHSRAVFMLDSGAEMWVVQQALGHKSITTTMNIYGIHKPSDLRKKIPPLPGHYFE